MIYLDYAKATPNGYILNFFADKEADISDISNGQKFVTKNGIDYGKIKRISSKKDFK